MDAFAQALNWVNQNTPQKVVNPVQLELAIGDYQRGMLAGSSPKAATLVQRKDGSDYIQIVDTPTA